MHVVRLADCPWVAWRNGGGRTRELATWGDGGEWRLRVSVAEIAADGAFSSFDGIDRWFAVLAGNGVALTLPNGVREIFSGDDATMFSGESAPYCRLLDGPTLDLNVMLRRGTGRLTLTRSPVRAREPVVWRGVFTGDTLWWSDEPTDFLPPVDTGWWIRLDS